MGVSRSAREFLARAGIVAESAGPRPRFCPQDLLVNRVPLASPPLPATRVLLGYEGDPAPDRARSRPWPGRA